MDTTYPPNESQVEEQARNLASRAQGVYQTAKKIRTAYVLITTSPALGLALGTFLALSIVGLVIAYVAINITQHPGVDTLDLLFQCQVAGQPLDENCINSFWDKAGTQLAPDEDTRGTINNPNPTFQN